MTETFWAAFDALPQGTFRGNLRGVDYLVTKTSFAGGKSQKIVAEEAGGTGYISGNVYRLASGPRLFPCEMPAGDVVDFVLNLRVGGDAVR